MDQVDLSRKLADLKEELKRVDDEIRVLQRRRAQLAREKTEVEKQMALQSVVTVSGTSVWESDSFEWSADCNRLLKETFGHDSFRPLQRSVINSVLSRNDTIVVMSTGGGKSLCYQLPAVLLKGLTLVISPLISLIDDQILQLKKLSIEAATLNQSTSNQEATRVLKALLDNHSHLYLLYVTPEKIARSKRLMNYLEKCAKMGRLTLIAVDEVHCCSQWGYDFRPDYKFLNILKRLFKEVPLLGLTATASTSIINDVKEILNIQAATVFYADFNRPNLFYEVRHKPGTEELLAEMISLITGQFNGQSGIIYCFTRKECEDLAKKLQEKGVKAAYYHAYMDGAARSKTHEEWIRNELQVIVATVAFGMGIDKPDVRFVIHHSMAKSVENYYQESGRAGRDGKQSLCILYFRVADLFRQSTMVCTEKNGLTYLYTMLYYCLQNTVCRRTVLAKMYNVKWDPSNCDRNCDVCARNGELVTTDVTFVRKNMCGILSDFDKKDRRLTGAKLIELALKNDPNLRRELAEKVLANLLLLHYFEEDFHFTPYAIISYIRLTHKGNACINDESPSMEIKEYRELCESSVCAMMGKRRRVESPTDRGCTVP